MSKSEGYFADPEETSVVAVVSGSALFGLISSRYDFLTVGKLRVNSFSPEFIFIKRKS